MTRPRLPFGWWTKRAPGAATIYTAGCTFDWDTQRDSFAHGPARAVSYIDILRYGGIIPGMKGNTLRVACPDADVINIFEITVEKQINPENGTAFPQVGRAVL